MCLWISVSGFNLWMGIEEYIYSASCCVLRAISPCGIICKKPASPINYTHPQCTSENTPNALQRATCRRNMRSDCPDCTGIPITSLPQGQAKRKPAPVWLKLLIRHSLFCSLIHMQPPTWHFSWALNSDEVKVADFSTGGQRFCCPYLPIPSVTMSLGIDKFPSVRKISFLSEYLTV